ncbi:SGNH/GDSL hydrolase family protein [Paenisporosarcina antarctica]|uniref:SGNH/GDSL hydrolase family protein n=1 Tax=Paenisporosarcina antarctica TaxID=417367 RepID=A0A4V1ANK7_9BACL|nr:SGNH/GDSL hydrolase family protein [Paenisporosarcina antarctica]QBP43115.1 SGNH/GDSL hydrolase family protein [Paenisporosarcina antarctica]
MFKAFLILLVISLVFSTSAFAKNDNGKNSLVALGDSIPFGYNLDANNNHPSKKAFPFLMGKEADLRVNNLGIPGLTTDGMLNLLQTNQKYRQAVKHADYITLNIGSNDLIAALRAAAAASGGDTEYFKFLLMQNIENSNIVGKLKLTIAEIRKLSAAPIVIHNIYNPFQEPEYELQFLATKLLPDINKIFLGLVYANENVVLADAYTAFGSNQAKYVIAGDIHPTVAGHEKLAGISLAALGLNKKEKQQKKKKKVK